MNPNDFAALPNVKSMLSYLREAFPQAAKGHSKSRRDVLVEVYSEAYMASQPPASQLDPVSEAPESESNESESSLNLSDEDRRVIAEYRALDLESRSGQRRRARLNKRIRRIARRSRMSVQRFKDEIRLAA